ncbi:AsmA-like C-terminal region-containing protein [Frigidibacter sp.]|uniref:AsmA-like C-terminal region-containing protein n=1 Tax=Frigidibacter sp. TaxID=2586418 RepID=UPI00273582CF|nr:AsmA-like C-terminal region-containing protein [Frigidibacter sp.]MDP3340914.1 AsmA-like C-terminal region-containing protein [Frigidibacter sp.]
MTAGEDELRDGEAGRQTAVLPPARRRRGRLGLWLLLSLALIMAASGFGVMALTGRPILLPSWAVERIEARINLAMSSPAGSPAGTMKLGAVELLVDARFVPRVRLRGVEIRSGGAPVALLPELRASFWPKPLLRGRLEPRSLRISGAQVMLRRTPDGALDLAFMQGAAAGARHIGSLPEGLEALEEVFALPVLAGIARIEADDLGIVLDDQRAGQRWIVSNGRLSLTQDIADLAIGLSFEVAGEGEEPASAQLSLTSSKTGPEASFGATVTRVPAADLAAQAPALAWLAVLDAPISGAFRSGVDAQGRVGQMDGTLEIGTGALRPVEGVRPVAFEGAKLYFSYDPAAAMIDFREVTVESAALRARGTARAWLQGMETGFPTGLVAQVALSDLLADPLGLFETPIAFQSGAMDLKLTLDPFQLSIGQFVLVDEGGRRIAADGTASADAEGWDMALDVTLDAVAHDRLLALWPVTLVPGTRRWIAENVTTGELFDVRAAVRLKPGTEPRMSLDYAFRGAEVRVLKTLPPVQDGSGYATIADNAHTLVVDRGHVVAPNGEPVDMAGSVMTVPDIEQKPAPVEIVLRTASTISAALSLLDEPPFRIMQRAGRGIDIAEGRAEAEAKLKLTLAPRVRPEDVEYDVTARLTEVRSDKVVAGREVRSEGLDLRANRQGMTLSGPGTISGVPFRMAWRQEFGQEQQGRSRLDGTVELSPRFLKAFGIGLPEGMVRGEGIGDITIDLAKDSPPAFRLRSDLNRVALAIPEIGWSKGAAQTGSLDVSGRLGSPPSVDALKIEAAGLSANGSVALQAGGGLEAVRLPQVQVGGWFNGGVELRGRGQGRAPAVVVTGGTADLRRAEFGSGSGGGGGDSPPIQIALDRLTVSETLSLQRLRGEFSSQGGFSGRFTGLVNGAAEVSGTVAPTRGSGRTGVRLQSQDAGAVFRATGIFSRARGGVMDLVLTPRGTGKGSYDGALAVRDLRVQDAPVLAELLSAVSVIGLLEQMGGEGLLFNTVDGRFTLSPDRVEIVESAAMGASLGVSMSGVYGLKSGRMELRGVVSPLYMVNALGQIVSRRGEGLFGFNYTISGTAKAPAVSVNPLSILTPGIFREIFRSDPPRVTQ